MRIVAALGGNALLQRGQKLTWPNQLANAKTAMGNIAQLVEAGHEVILTHGNGPQIGLLSLQDQAYEPDHNMPLEAVGAQTDGMIGYVLSQELGNALRQHSRVATLLTRIEVDSKDIAFTRPTKPIGPVFDQSNADQMASEMGWTMVKDGNGFRRAVPSPTPQNIVEEPTIKLLLKHDLIVVCAGGGGIPVARNREGQLEGVEAVIDKDHASALLADRLNASILMLLTDVEGVYDGWGTAHSQLIDQISPGEIASRNFPAGSMLPKARAAADFARKPGRTSMIGNMAQATDMLAGIAGTQINLRFSC